jgi:hypothetical protein
MATFSLSEIIERYKLRKSGRRWVGPCPKPDCGGSATSDKFNLWEDGGFRCYGCDWRGDVITWLRDMEGMSCPEAHEAANRACRKTDCRVYGTCRMGDGSGGQQTSYRPKSVAPRAGAQDESVRVTVPTFPVQIWLDWALPLLEKAQENLLEKTEELTWLGARGIDLATARRAGFGWLDHDIRVNRASIGLSPEKDGKERLWIPGGLLIPIFDRRGNLHRLRVRRTPEARAKFLPKLKYVWIEGSGTGPLVIRPDLVDAAPYRGVAILEAELDAWACAAAHDECLVIGLGTVSAGLPQSSIDELHRQPSIMISFDADPERVDGKEPAGPKAAKKWLATFRQAKFWPVLDGKDAGDYAKLGADLHAWLDAGLAPRQKTTSTAAVPAVQPQTRPDEPPLPPEPDADYIDQLQQSDSATAQDLPFYPERAQRGGGGKKIYSKNDEMETDEYVIEIKALSDDMRADALAAYQMMQAHPITPWMSKDGLSGGIVTTGNWRQNYPELSKQFERLFYGPAYPALCEIFRELFISNARLHGKGGRYIEPVAESEAEQQEIALRACEGAADTTINSTVL